MDIKKIKTLAELLDKYSLTELEYTEADTKISLKREAVIQTVAVSNNIPQQPIVNDINEPIAVNDPVFSFGDINEIKAPLVGVFYSSPSPDSAPYVTVGSKVKKGDILCIVEAMKLMNEIIADDDGEIIDVCVENGQVVEYGQTLFKII